MAFVHSKSSRLFLNQKHISCQIRGFTASGSRTYGDSTALCDEGARQIPGLMEGSINLDGMFESDTVNTGIHELLQSTINVDNGATVTVTPAGYALGMPAFIVRADPSGYEIESSVNDTTTLSFEGQADDGTDWGLVQHDFGTAATATANDTSIDNTLASTRGGVATLHVPTISGTSPTLNVKIQHSVDNSVWVDLITFTQVTSTATYQYATVAGTVNRYVRASYTIAGTTPSYNFVVAFARR